MTSVDNTHDDLSQRHHPSRLFVEVTSRCNLRCAICVKQSGAAKSIDGDMLPETFNALAPELKHLQALVLNGIGEPLLHPLLEEFIRTGKRSMPARSWVGFQTNGHLLDTARSSSLIAAGLDRIFLSVDSTSPELFKAVRGGGSLGHIERALTALAQAKKEHPGNTLEVGAEFVVMRDNIAELPSIIAWLAKRGVSRLVVSHVLPFSSALADQTVFGINTNSAKYFYEAWSDQARQEGIDITQYFNVLWKYHKTPHDLRLVSFVQRMVSQALETDISLHVANLTDGDDVGPVEAVFRKAEAVAGAVGLRLLLPPVRPVSGHACLGVKQGGAFIAWDGKVSPCHFLWRSFNCYFYGREKQVAHKLFGDLSHDSLTEIWNSSNYKAFRSDVMQKRYPHCPGCNVFPCEDINSIDFEYDCYGETVPCGDCLWSMGLLQCMGQEDESGEFHDCCDDIHGVDKFKHTDFGVPAQV
ncbi:Radical SAM domain protein [Desulfovibrio sp. DV]|uniref:radical SAM/SPASM family putative metalloenzyme maturase n=1 Tax=Desulfovibrio sp. DV TaxID=1844708 RepID=UPI00094B9BE5|nr:radical SAM/SPASM family putative metalloenzyme maturase [Desulfovibrio sp. DV]OLN30721.1 Radical SAM domain protein [Desulfovibrio sp. DV]